MQDEKKDQIRANANSQSNEEKSEYIAQDTEGLLSSFERIARSMVLRVSTVTGKCCSLYSSIKSKILNDEKRFIERFYVSLPRLTPQEVKSFQNLCILLLI